MTFLAVKYLVTLVVLVATLFIIFLILIVFEITRQIFSPDDFLPTPEPKRTGVGFFDLSDLISTKKYHVPFIQEGIHNE